MGLYASRAISWGTCASAEPESAQSGHWLRPCQLFDGKLAGASKAKAASQPKSPKLGMCLVRLPFHKVTAVLLEPSWWFLDTQKWNRKK
jgi:hypothetical protein